VRPELKENEMRAWKIMQKNTGSCFSKVQLNVTVHRNRLKVSTTSDILLISNNNENVD
jgi:hypothetical protein